MKKLFSSLFLFLIISIPCTAGRVSHVLRDGWIVQEGNNTYHTSLPATAMGILVKNGVYSEKILSGLNYKQVDKSHFDHPWLFSNYFGLPALHSGQHVFLKINGLSYSANILVNEKLIASRDSVQGPFRQYMFDITKWIGTRNHIDIQVFRAGDKDPNIGFVDWNPRAADRSMGIFRDVSIEIVDDVLMQHTTVQSKVNTQTLKEAWLTVQTELTNLTDRSVKGALVGKLDNNTYLYYPVTLKAGEKRMVKVTPEDVSKLHISNPRLWWCNNLGSPNLYNLSLEFDINARVCDKNYVTFGIREVKDYLTPEGYRGLLLNGKKVLVRGAGWTDDIFLRDTPDTYEEQIEYVKDMHLNAIRLEGMWGNSEDLFNLCDRNGIMILPGWSCQWEWAAYVGGDDKDKYGCISSVPEMNMLVRELHDQVLWLRNHPSIVCWFIGSDKLPRPELERGYRNMLAKIDSRPIFSSASNRVSEVSGTTGVKMEGPYEYVGPRYWFEDNKFGSAYGFNTETGIGAQLPIKESIEKMIPADKLWPVNNEYYNYHCTASTTAMHSLDVLTDVIDKKFGGASNLDDYLKKADLLNYDGTRSMFEAFRVNIPHTTGIIQWMLNSAWPSLYWQLYDYYGVPTAAYYSVKTANVPQQLIYNYKDRAVYLVNEGLKPMSVTGNLKMFDMKSKLIQQNDTTLTIAPYMSMKVFNLKDIQDDAFLFLNLRNDKKKEIAENTYCVPAKDDIYEWNKSTWYDTPLEEAANYKSLATLPTTTLQITAKQTYATISVTVKNTSDKISFFNNLILKNGDGSVVKYAKWSDNYITLQPGETKKLECAFTHPRKNLSITVRGWNTKEQVIKI